MCNRFEPGFFFFSFSRVYFVVPLLVPLSSSLSYIYIFFCVKRKTSMPIGEGTAVVLMMIRCIFFLFFSPLCHRFLLSSSLRYWFERRKDVSQFCYSFVVFYRICDQREETSHLMSLLSHFQIYIFFFCV